MSTHANIALLKPNGDIRSIYCHYDGYPQYVGQILQEHYNNQERVEQLIALGNIEALGEKLEPSELELKYQHWYSQEYLSLDKEERERLRLDAKKHVRKVIGYKDPTLAKALNHLCLEEYIYIFTPKGWYMVRPSDPFAITNQEITRLTYNIKFAIENDLKPRRWQPLKDVLEKL